MTSIKPTKHPFSLRIITCDYYLTKPSAEEDVCYSSFMGRAISRVPVVRIFGTSNRGEKTCLHLHGIFPYFFVSGECIELSNEFLIKFAVSIEKAMNVRLNHEVQNIFKMQIVRGKPFYGFYYGQQIFVKIFVYDPGVIPIMISLLRSKAILNYKFDIYEAHVPFLLQVFCDFNLRGMDFIKLSNVKFRPPLHSSYYSLCPFSVSKLTKQTYSQIEVDGSSSDVLNQLERLEYLKDPPDFTKKHVKYVESLAKVWDELKQFQDGNEHSPNTDQQPSAPLDTQIQQKIQRVIEEETHILDEALVENAQRSGYIFSMHTESSESSLSKTPPSNMPLHLFPNELPLPSDSSNQKPEINELLVMSQTGDQEIEDILNWMKEQDIPSSDSEDEISVEKEIQNIIASQKELVESSDEFNINSSISQLDGKSDPFVFIRKSKRYCSLFSNSENQSKAMKSFKLEKKSKKKKKEKKKKKKKKKETVDIIVPETQPLLPSSSKSLKVLDPKPGKKVSFKADLTTNIPSQIHYFQPSLSNQPNHSPQISNNLPHNTPDQICPMYDFPTIYISDSIVSLDSVESPKPQDLIENVIDYDQTNYSYTSNETQTVYLNQSQHEAFSDSPLPFKSNLIMYYKKPPAISGREILPNNETVVQYVEPFEGKLKRSAEEIPEWNSKRLKLNPESPKIITHITPVKDPPHPKEIEKWFRSNQTQNFHVQSTKEFANSQVDISTPRNTHGFILSIHDNPQKDTCLTLCSLEIHANSRLELKPDPKYDAVSVITYSISDEDGQKIKGILIQGLEKNYSLGIEDCTIQIFDNEFTLFKGLIDLIQTTDPDVLIGYEVQLASIGYLIERATVLGINLCKGLSRTVDDSSSIFDKTKNVFEFSHSSGIKITGRIILNNWRIMRTEAKLNNYSLENTVYHVLHKRIPQYSFLSLTQWFKGPQKWRTVVYYLERSVINLELLEKLDIIQQTCEMARLFGIDFYSVLSRGSQYRVESVLLRLTKLKNMIMISPNKQEVAQQRPIECIPLVMEPESKLYTSPVLVLDFQSLYPSIIIAYNYCYSTCLGKLLETNNHFKKFGTTYLSLPLGLLSHIQNKLNVSPNEVLFTNSSYRIGVLPRMLQEILDTRVMIKKAMNKVKDDKVLYRTLFARQLGLKNLANVTYGYTSASFSGRMPCVDIADSIVQTARETLEKAIKLVEGTSKWKAKVVYGDTDSLFVLLDGATREEAFQIGQEIANAVTESNPKPIKLQFEKIYHPCLLVTKKRYVGMKYESATQKEGVLDAKGIETVRRDSCPLVQQILEKSIKILFLERNLSLIKDYLQRQWIKILRNKLPLKEYIFSKEVRIGTYKQAPPAAIVAAKQMVKDYRTEPRYAERVQYIVAFGPPGATLRSMCFSPTEFLQTNLQINTIYYISKQIIPALSRLFALVGVDIQKWYDEMPKTTRIAGERSSALPLPKITITDYYISIYCNICGKICEPKNLDGRQDYGICNSCWNDRQSSNYIVQSKLRKTQEGLTHLKSICMQCTAVFDSNTGCISLDCPVYFELLRQTNKLSQIENLGEKLF